MRYNPQDQNVVFTLAETRPEEMEIEAFDNTKLVAIATCPTYGILRYGQHKTMRDQASQRRMPLEVGKTAHDFYAAVRLVELATAYPEHFAFHGKRIFGDRWEAMMGFYDPDDLRKTAYQMGSEAMQLGWLGDDPSDRRRTLTNIEEAAIAWFERYPFMERTPWVEDENDPTKRVGVEMPFDCIVTAYYKGETEYTMAFRLTGRFDGLMVRKDGSLVLDENKTASRVTGAWGTPYHMASQITTYLVAALVITKQPIKDALVMGMQVPQPKTSADAGIIFESVWRTPYQIQKWLHSTTHQLHIYFSNKENVLHAPQHTHSCNRYFSTCEFIPFCTADSEEDARQLHGEMRTDEWSPLTDDAGSGAD